MSAREKGVNRHRKYESHEKGIAFIELLIHRSFADND